ncbi:hypothetical protein [Rhizobium rhizogenes]|uniref:hypothetical protein n=1 Tax=Rhizobium rhizogenes TaxID=359 RepID=UPI001574A837|nr:hypothetical protein [Rhizobium rhizogenes]NTF44690.1 hypothetical protein [Rhizobium rhizogenes]
MITGILWLGIALQLRLRLAWQAEVLFRSARGDENPRRSSQLDNIVDAYRLNHVSSLLRKFDEAA